MQRATRLNTATAIVVGSFVFGLVGEAGAQAPGVQGQGQRQRGPAATKDGAGPKPYQLPSDERLKNIHEKFVTDAMKLAAEYEKAGQHDKARDCYSEILRLVPIFTPATEKIAKIKEKEMTAENKKFDVYANRDWQDAGIQLIEGRPVTIRANGQWTIKMNYNVEADGLEIPKELRDFPLGALIAKVADSPDEKEVKPFLVGKEKTFEAPTNGRLFLRIYDSDTLDNMGRVFVTVEGSFKKQ